MGGKEGEDDLSRKKKAMNRWGERRGAGKDNKGTRGRDERGGEE